MKKCFQWPLLVFLVSCFLICGFLKSAQAQVDLKSKIDAGEYVQRVNNCMVIIDASYSMAKSYNGQKKLTIAKDTAMLMNNTIPDMDLQIALRKFGQKNWQLSESTELVYDFGGYSREEFEEAINKVKRTVGRSPLHLAIDASTKNLEETQGETAVIIFSDGQNMGDFPVKAAERMKENMGERICIYTVQIGDNEKGKECLENIAQASECGFLTNADEISSDEAMADFVAKIFLNQASDTDGDGVPDSRDNCPDTPQGVAVDENGCPPDSDGDGVSDYLDKCPDTPEGVTVDESGCPLDTDGDGVPDYLDKCPDTPKGAKVDERGCWVIQMDKIGFDFNKWDLKPQAYPALNEVVSILKTDPKLKIEIQGHTDNIGSEEYNKGLSEKRAQAVMNYLIQQGIENDRLSTKGFWFSRPIESNDTEEGRAKNRRVEFQPIR